MNIRLATPADAENCGRVIYEAFGGVADLRPFPHDFPSVEAAQQLAQLVVNNPNICGYVAEDDGGNFVGSNFLWEHDRVRGVGPITIDPQAQGAGAGRRLMQAVIERGRDAASIRLVQDACNTVSMSLYASLGFDVVEPLVVMQGEPRGETSGKTEVRPLAATDYEECAELCRQTHGFDRANELKEISQMSPAFVAAREGRIVAYASAPVFWQMNHAVAESVEDMQDLLLGAAKLLAQPLSFLLPTRQAKLFRWCLRSNLRVVKPLTLMAMGEYQEPRNPFLPSVLY